jgi:hypothetical protein
VDLIHFLKGFFLILKALRKIFAHPADSHYALRIRRSSLNPKDMRGAIGQMARRKSSGGREMNEEVLLIIHRFLLFIHCLLLLNHCCLFWRLMHPFPSGVAWTLR